MWCGREVTHPAVAQLSPSQHPRQINQTPNRLMTHVLLNCSVAVGSCNKMYNVRSHFLLPVLSRCNVHNPCNNMAWWLRFGTAASLASWHCVTKTPHETRGGCRSEAPTHVLQRLPALLLSKIHCCSCPAAWRQLPPAPLLACW